MSNKVKKVKIECQDCDTTGLHIGHLEGKGTATICTTCNGNGYIEAEYIPFKKRKRLRGVKKVFQSAFGCPIFVDGEGTYELENGNQIIVNFDNYNCSYDDWFNNNQTPILLKELTCPLIASNQDINVVEKMRCNDFAEMGNPIAFWACYENRDKCWMKYDEK